jgi:hypothetical protein
MKEFGLDPQDERLYGLKDKSQGILISKIDDIGISTIT